MTDPNNAANRSISTPTVVPRRSRAGRQRDSRWSERLRIAFDGGLLFLLIIVPLLMGGRHPLGRLVYESTVCFLAACWLIRNCLRRDVRWRFSGLEWLWMSALALFLLQLVPLPPVVLNAMSPYQRELLPAWFTSDGTPSMMGSWSTISLAPLATRDGLAMFAVHATLFSLLVQRMDHLEDVEQVLHWIAFAVISMAGVGLLQYFSGTEHFAWVFHHPTRDASRMVTGPFENANHYAHFLTLGLGSLLAWLQLAVQSPARQSFGRLPSRAARGKPERDLKIIGLTLAMSLVVLAVVLTRSRGGILVAFGASTCCVGMLVLSRVAGYRTLVALGLIGVVAAAGVYLHGHERIGKELGTLVQGSWEQIDRGDVRWKLWNANLQIARRFPIAGAGVGCHVDLHEVFFPYNYDASFVYAESGYLQILTEMGLPGIGLLSIAIGVVVAQAWRGWRTRRSVRQTICLASVVSSLAASLIHSIFDFPWYIPCCMGTTVILLACLTRLSCLAPDGELPAAERPAMPQFARIQLAVIWVVSLVVLAATQIPAARAARAWNDYLRVSLAQTTMNLNQFSQANDPAYIERQKRENGDRTRLMARYLEEVLARDPRDARAHARLAYQCVRVFEELQMRSENAIDLVSLSDAALASHFPDVATQDRWLQAAVGENRRWLDLAQYHLYQALHISPLQGNAYLHLSQIAFLQGIDRKGSRRLLEQAHRVRPYEASVLFGLGRDAMLRGDHSTAMVFWKQAFHQSDEYREQIILQLAGASSATEFVEYFEPDEEGIRILFAFYRGADLESQAREIAPLLATRQCEKARALEGRDAANMWENANQTFRYLENSAESLACARQAVEAAPLRYQSRLLLAQELVRCSQWSEALDALDWCMLRRPQDTTLQRMHRAASRGLAHGAVARSQSQTTKSGR